MSKRYVLTFCSITTRSRRNCQTTGYPVVPSPSLSWQSHFGDVIQSAEAEVESHSIIEPMFTFIIHVLLLDYNTPLR